MTVNAFDRLLTLLQQLEKAHIHYSLTSNREEAITIEVAVPGQRWEIDCFADGTIEVEIFKSDGTICDESAIKELFRNFSD